MSEVKYLSRGIDYLGNLGKDLRNLQGFKTLAHELIQNADDVPDATSMTFDVRDSALVVDNDGTFSDCGQVERPECPWKDNLEKAHRCDFHRFRYVASGDKRAEEGTTGAFGIGFIAVYQITDYPELISATRHWVLHEDKTEAERIGVCPGCDKCNALGLPKTRFVLPWALDPNSTLRQKLGAEALSQVGKEALLEELEKSLPLAMLFLKRLRTVELRKNGYKHRIFQRLDDGNSLILSYGDKANDCVWHLIRGDFSDVAESLRAAHPARIEKKRTANVTIAIPADTHCNGLLCAYLPTEQNTGFPFHINADFFPTSDRKRVITGADYQADWNRSALRGAASALAAEIPQLPSVLGPRYFWNLLDAVKKIADMESKQGGEQGLGSFWGIVAPSLKTANIIYTTRKEWSAPERCHLLLQKEEATAIPVLEKLGLNIVHEDLRPYQVLLRSESVGVPVLDIRTVCDALSKAGLDRPLQRNELPALIADDESLNNIWAEITRIFDRQQRNTKPRLEDELHLKNAVLAPTMDSALVPCKDAYVSDSETVGLFKPLFPKIAWLADNPNFKPLRDLCPTFGVSAAISKLELISKEDIAIAWKTERLDLKKLFAWFENRRQEIIGSAEVKRKLANLAIFPSSWTLQTLVDVALPGNFDDHLGLAEIVDLAATGGRREFLQDLGMKALDFKVYAGRLPEALKRPGITIEKRRQVVELVAKRIGEIQDDSAVRMALASAPLIECTDGEFREAAVCYFDGDAVRDCLGGRAHIAAVPVGKEAAFHGFYQWLGVAVEPRIPNIVSRVAVFANNPWSATIAQAVASIMTHLGKRQINEEESKELRGLCSVRWLPAEGKTDRWYSADELYASYQAYLFKTQALFLDVPVNIQRSSASLLAFLGVKDTPNTILVVKHLLHCATNGMSVHPEVYRFLNDKVDDPAVNQLKGKKCLWWNDSYVAPGDVFWGEHPFGSYRYRLSDELLKYGKFLNHIGVRNAPDFADAVAVLKEISVNYNANRTPINEIDLAVLMACWRLLDGALDQDDCRIEVASLRGIHCVSNAVKLLNPPEWMFFENRAGLAEKFGEFLAGNVIPRPLGAARAMSVAGVRSLGAAVQVQLLECEDPTEDVEVAALVRCRRNELGRVLDTQIPGNNIGAVLDRLKDIQFEAVSTLIVRYQLRVFNQALESNPETAPAIYQPEDRRLIVMRHKGVVPWPALARELAIALLPDDDPGRIAAGLKEVLIAASTAEAACALDELGYPKMDTTDTQATGSGDSLVTLGTDEPMADTFVPDTPGVNEGHNAAGGMTPDEAISMILGEGAPAPTPAPPGLGAEPTVGGAASGSKERGGATSNATTSSKTRPVLRSYVPAPDASGMPPEVVDGDGEESHTPVDEAGIRKVLAHETTCGRIPKEMPHNNPGYDIESYDDSGKVVRYIEVKSMSGQWTDGYAVLSRRQFKKAYTDDVPFWLYVVDRAETEKSHIYRIQNPTRRANHFMFDDGWRVVAEEESEKQPQEIS